jgi:lysophospholipase
MPECRDSQTALAFDPPPSGSIGYLEAADGLAIRHASWRSEILPHATVLVLTGRTEFVEKYYETVRDLLMLGCDTLVFDWRGQGLSGRMLPRHPMRGHVGSYDQYLTDVELLLERVVTPWARAPIVILAHSMGGHIALRLLHDRPEAVACAVLSAPMVEINLGLPRPLAGLIAGAMVRLGLGGAYAPRQRDYNPATQPFESNPLTGDPARFKATHELLAATPGLALGGVTYGWLAATLQSSAILLAPGYAEAITTPVLICQPVEDTIVRNVAQDALVVRMPNATLQRFTDARHELLMERDAVRATFLEVFFRFLQENMPNTASSGRKPLAGITNSHALSTSNEAR